MADSRRWKREASPPLDARAVFYGRPLLEFLAQVTFAAFQQQKATNEHDVYETLKQIRASWLHSQS